MMKLLQVSGNQRFLQQEDGTPFFWLADTAWELFHKLNREEAELYLNNRASRGFNVVQAVALAELEGLTAANAYGRLPLLPNSSGMYDPAQPDLTVHGEGAGNAGTPPASYTYWDHVDYIIDLAASLNIYIALLPTWGDKYNLKWGKGPVVFNPDNARQFGRWIGNRYAERTHIIWVLGGDRPLEEQLHFDIIRAMAEGIKEADKRHLMTFHPCGGLSSSRFVHGDPWLDFNMIQSGHGSEDLENFRHVTHDYCLLPTKPTLDAEPRYEDHPVNFKPENRAFNDFDVRQAAYWSVFAGAFGHTYGHHSIWSMTTEPGNYFLMDWQTAIDRPAGNQMQHLRKLMESRPFFERIPDQSLIIDSLTGGDTIRATRGEGYAFIYSPTGQSFEVRMGVISGDTVNAAWYDPRNGNYASCGSYPNEGVIPFTPPSKGRGSDWVLALDSCPNNDH